MDLADTSVRLGATLTLDPATERVTGEHVGAFFREGLTGIEIGWSTYRAFWGQGIASEAAAEAVRYAFEPGRCRRARAW